MAKRRLTQTKVCNFNVHLMSVKLKFGTITPFGYLLKGLLFIKEAWKTRTNGTETEPLFLF